MSLDIREQSIVALLSILVTSFKYEKIIEMIFVESKMTKKLKIILAIVRTKMKAFEIIDVEKIIPDNEFMMHYIFPILVVTLDDYINDMMISLMDKAEKNATSGEYLRFCNSSMSVVDDFKKIKMFLDVSDIFKS
jgi:hypothetical protein